MAQKQDRPDPSGRSSCLSALAGSAGTGADGPQIIGLAAPGVEGIRGLGIIQVVQQHGVSVIGAQKLLVYLGFLQAGRNGLGPDRFLFFGR